MTASRAVSPRLMPAERASARTAEHEIMINAPAASVYLLIAQIRDWPQIFSSAIYVHQEEAGDRAERIRIWSTDGGEAKTWVSRRTLDPAGLRIGFQEEAPSPPVTTMTGTWIIEESAAGSRVRLVLESRVLDGDSLALARINEAVDRDAQATLTDLKHHAEQAAGVSGMLFSLSDTIRIGGSLKDAYDFINDAQLWPGRLAHVDSSQLSEDVPGLQRLAMVTRMPNGSAHPTESYRVCFPYRRIAYKHIIMPALMSVHTGCWVFAQDDLGVSVTSRQTVVLHAAVIKSILGPNATFAEARGHVEHALSLNSRATLTGAKKYAEHGKD